MSQAGSDQATEEEEASKQPQQQQQQQNPPSSKAPGPRAPSKSDWFAIPGPLLRLFKRFPLATYPPNALPHRSPSARELPTLYVFASDHDAVRGLPSFNPSCLKWQTFLKLAGVAFRTLPSTNHASPTGALPFLVPASSPSDTESQRPVPASKLEQYAADHGARPVPDVPILKTDAYQSLLDHRIRNAWLHALYLARANTPLLRRLYVAPVSAAWAVQATVLYQLRRAAEAEIARSAGTPAVDPAGLYADAEQAFAALAAAALGPDDGDWCFGNAGPGLFDAALFAYTHLILDDDALAWGDTRLRDALVKFPRLVEHRDRILARCWGTKG